MHPVVKQFAVRKKLIAININFSIPNLSLSDEAVQ